MIRGMKIPNKYIRFLLFSVLLSVVFFSCLSPYDLDIITMPEDNLPPEMGSVTLTLSSSRTIMPAAPALNHYTHFELIFTATPSGVNKTIVKKNSELSNPVVLAAGTYSLKVNAYRYEPTSSQPQEPTAGFYIPANLAAASDLTSVTITATQNTNCSVTIKPLFSGGANGIFSWNIIYPGFVNAQASSVTISTSATPPVSTSHTFDQTGSVSLAPGIYTATFTMKGTGTDELVWDELVHIYSTLTSTFSKNFTAGHFYNTHHTVQFVCNDNNGTTSQQSVMHGTVIPNANVPDTNSLAKTADAYLYANPVPSNIGYTFGGWYTDPDFISPWTIATAPVHSSMTLYAKWTGPIDIYSRHEPNNFEKAIGYVKSAPNQYTLFLNGSFNGIAPQTLDNANINLTVQGLGTSTRTLSSTGTLFTVGAANTQLTLGKLNLNGNGTGNLIEVQHSANLRIESSCTVNGTVYANALSGTFTLANTATVETITLLATAATPKPSISIVSNWTGSVNCLNLKATTAQIDDPSGTISYWVNQSVLKAATGTLTGKVERFTLGNFVDDNGNIAPISDTHRLEDDGANIGKLVPLGSGSQNDPFQIWNESALRRVGTGTNGWTLTANYILMADIPLTQGNWLPIGSGGNPFYGTFDGNEKTISNLTINTNSTQRGMFGYIGVTQGLRGEVKNLSLTGVSISGTFQVGGVAGYNGGTIYNCHLTGNVSGQIAVGGIAGENSSYAEVTNCYMAGSVTGTGLQNNPDPDETGGIVGCNGGTIANCYSTANVTGVKATGGIVGSNRDIVNAAVRNCYSTGNVTGTTSVGGIAGQISRSGITVTNCYASGSVTGTTMNAGGIVGDCVNGAIVTNCVALNSIVAVYYPNPIYVGRIIGNIAAGGTVTMSGNYAWGSMPVKYNVPNDNGILDLTLGNPKNTATTGNANGVDGEGKTAVQIVQKTAWDTTPPDFAFGYSDIAPWVWIADRMPSLYYGTAQQWPDYLEDVVTEVFMEMVLIPAGTFTMGSPSTETGRDADEGPQRQVTLNSFYMGKYEVTQEQYQSIMGYDDSAHKTQPATGENQSKRPVEYLYWYEAIVFCNKLSLVEGYTPAYTIGNLGTNPSNWPPFSNSTQWNNNITFNPSSNGYRLPTEAEWEYACRAGTNTPYNNNSNSIDTDYGWYAVNSGNKTHEVGKKPANAYGLYDMHGNVVEWCWDWFGNYTASPQTNPTGPSSGTFRVCRGGGYSYNAVDLRSAYREYLEPNNYSNDLGFRVVRNAP